MENLKIKLDNLLNYVDKIGNCLYKYRYFIAIILFILCVLFEISGSSIGIWKEFGVTDVEDDGVIWGTSRAIRSDEWAVLTPMMFSQQFDGFKYFSDIIRADKTDVFIVYGSPVLNLMQIFRPFLIGFLFLGISKGLSFFWCGRFIALFLVMLELFMILSKKNKLLSFLGAIMITLAPIVQWWFAVNGIVEIFVFGGLAVILLDKYMKNNNFTKRCLYLLGMIICAGGYILVFYPAWQIPMFYVFLALAVWVIIENRKQCKINRKDIFAIVVTLIVFISCMAYILLQSWDTIKLVMNTVYPGYRSLTGGGTGNKYFEYAMNIFLPFKDVLLDSNTSEKALVFGLFPIGIIISLFTMIKEKKKDLLLILLLVIYAFLGIWVIIGFPEIIAKITLMSNVQPTRAVLAVGFLDVLILIRSLAIVDKTLKRKTAIVLSFILSGIIVLACKIDNRQYITIKMGIAMAIMCVYLFYFALRYKEKYSKYLLTCGLVFVLVMCGLTVNPIRTGVDVIYESSVIKEVQKVNEQDAGKWIVEGIGFPIANFVLMAGVPVVNTTNTYPDLERWNKIDTEGKYEYVYNRYAHININLVDSEEKISEKFNLIQTDVFEVYLLPSELKELEIKYIFTPNQLEKYSNTECNFNKVVDVNGYNIYKVSYQ